MSAFKKRFGNQIGATLIEVLVVAGIMGVLAIFSTQLFSDVIKMQKLAEQKFGVVYMKNEMYQLLNSNLACTQSFAGLQFAYGATGSPSVFNVKQLKLATGEVIYRTFDDPAQTGAVYENRNLRIRSITLSDYKPNETPTDATDARFYTGTALVKIDFERNIDSVGPGQFSREIKVSVALKKQGDLSGGLGSPAYTAAEDKTIRNCVAMGSGSTESYWSATPANDGIFYGSGKVGIGTNAPQGLLHLASTGHSMLKIASPAASQPFVQFDIAGAQAGFVGMAVDAGLFTGVNNGDMGVRSQSTPLHLGAQAAPGVTILPNNNVGIGTTNPGTKLDIAGAIRVGSAGIAKDALCSPVGAIAYDSTADAPVYCSRATNRWALFKADGSGNALPGTLCGASSPPISCGGSVPWLGGGCPSGYTSSPAWGGGYTCVKGSN